jgi:type 1 fimbria pilin
VNVPSVPTFLNITNPPGPTPSTNVAVNLASQGYEDLHALSHTYPTCLAYNENQAYDLTWTAKVGSVNATAYPVATSVHITKGNFNGTLNVTLTVTTP